SGEGGFALHNRVGTPLDADMPDARRRAEARMRGARVALSPAHARAAIEAFREAADTHDLAIIIGAVMATHVHLVVRSRDAEGAGALQLLKGVSSRRLSQRFGRPAKRWWTRHGSRRLLTSEASYEAA